MVMPSDARDLAGGLAAMVSSGSLRGGKANRAARGRAAERRGEMKSGQHHGEKPEARPRPGG